MLGLQPGQSLVPGLGDFLNTTLLIPSLHRKTPRKLGGVHCSDVICLEKSSMEAKRTTLSVIPQVLASFFFF